MAEEIEHVEYEVYELPHIKNQPKTNKHGQCEKCNFWQSLKRGFPSPEFNVRGRKGDNIGECRLHAPEMVDFEVHWPVTYEFDWCGDFLPRAGTGGLARKD